MNARRLISMTLASLCAVAGLFALASAPALALETHIFSKSFAGEGEHALSDPQGVAIDQNTGEVYVVDTAHDRVEVFSASGAFIKAFGSAGSGDGQFQEPTQIAVDNSTGLPGDVYVLDKRERVEVFNAKGEYLAQVKESVGITENEGRIAAIAVDASGDLWVQQLPSSVYNANPPSNFYELPPGGALPGKDVFESERVYTPESGLTIGASGDFYAIQQYDQVFKYSPSGEYLMAIGQYAKSNEVALDPVDEGLYVDQGNADQGTSVAHYTASNVTGTPNDEFGSNGPDALVDGTGIAVSASGVVYVAEAASSRVDVFDPATLAEVAAGAATGVEKTAATLHGVVNPDEVPVNGCEFEYGTEAGLFPEKVPCTPAVSPAEPLTGDAPVAVSANPAALSAGTTYHYRLAATNAEGTNYSGTESFTTPPAVEGVITGPAEDVTASGAKLTGSLSPDGTDTHYYFQYGTSTSYGSLSPDLPGTDAGTGGPLCKPPGGVECSPVAAETTLSGLAANTTYHYRLVAVNSFGTTYGEDATVVVLGPPTIEGEAAEVKPERAGTATLRAQIDPDGRETTYHFEYGETMSYGTSFPVSPVAIGAGEAVVSVPAADLGGLKVGTTFHYRVVAVNEYGTVDGPDQTFTTLPAALIEASVSDVASTSATLEAQINPLGTDTTCQFQYVTAAGFQATGYTAAVTVPCPANLGEGETGVSASIHLQDFAPGTVYHYRAVAANALAPGGVDGPDRTFTTQGAGTELELPDNRTWEMVSPPEKEGALVEGYVFQGGAVQASADGSAFSYLTSSPTEAAPQGYTNEAQDLSWRAPDGGWSTKNITPPNEQATGEAEGDGNIYRLFSSDLTLAVVQPFGKFTPLSPEASEQTAYLHTDFLSGEVGGPCVSGCYRPLVTGEPGYANVPPGTAFACGAEFSLVCGPEFTDATPDLSHIVLSGGGLTKTRWKNGGGQLYEWSAGESPSEQLQPLYLLPESEGGDGVGVGSESEFTPSPLAHQLSDDGSAFFTYGSVIPRTDSGNHLYFHDVAKGESVRLDVAQGVAEPSEGDAGFLYASSDGSRVFFSDDEQLTKTPGGGVYECTIAEVAGRLACGQLELTGLTGLSEVFPNEGALVGGSEDASYLYFVSRVRSNESKLYVAHYDGSGWTQTLVAAVDGDLDTTRVSPNGRWLAFMSSQELTGYDTRNAISGLPGEEAGQRDDEVYLYNAETNRLVCASCNPTGALPVGEEVTEGNITGEARGDSWRAASVPEWTHYMSYGYQSGGSFQAGFESEGPGKGAVYQSRYLSDSGRLFFNSHDALVPQDVNGTWDVYEYEPPGVGDCTASSATFSSRSGGCVGLISSGTSGEESAFLDASEDGGDVFFLTSARLAPQDRDTATDVYDAHECTAAAPCPTTVTMPPPCTTGDACKPAPTPQPTLFGAPSSETFSGAGNIVPSTGPAVKRKSLTRAQKLANALKACRRRPKKRRAGCERQARRAYGSAADKARKSRSKGGR